MHIDHVNISAPLDLMEQVKDFYCHALQLEAGPRPDFGIPGYWLYGDGKPIVHLIQSDNHQRAEPPAHLDHVAIAVDDPEAYKARLDSLGVTYSVNHIPDFNVHQVFCHDPSGTGVEANFNYAR